MIGSLFFFLAIFASILEVPLDEINLTECKIKKENKEHTVYHRKGEYLKLWKYGTWHFKDGQNKMFWDAAKEGFFDGIAPLKAVITQNHQCLGYIVYECDRIKGIPFEILNRQDLTKMKETPEYLTNIYYRAMLDLYACLEKKMWETDYCLKNDFAGTWNLGMREGECYIFDLDHVTFFSEYQKRYPNRWKNWFFFLDLTNELNLLGE